MFSQLIWLPFHLYVPYLVVPASFGQRYLAGGALRQKLRVLVVAPSTEETIVERGTIEFLASILASILRNHWIRHPVSETCIT